MTRSGISVIIPAYNRADLIGQTLASLLNQTLPADEIIVVDDGSSDGTVQAAQSAFHQWEGRKVKGQRSPEFRVMRQENAGPGAARNRGFAESKGEFIHFFDSDDIAAPNKHEVQVRALQETGADIAYGPWVKGHIRDHGAGPLACSADWSERSGQQGTGGKRFSFEPEGHVLQQRGLPKGDLVKELLTRWSVVSHACLFRRSIVEKVGGFPELFGAEDQMMFLRCLLAGAKVVHTPKTIEFYRLAGSGKLTNKGDAQLQLNKEWGKFLIAARSECLRSNIEPLTWRGYRRRIWVSKLESEFKTATSAGAKPESRISWQLAEYIQRVTDLAERCSGSLKFRLTGNRQKACFRCGPITSIQLRLFPTF